MTRIDSLRAAGLATRAVRACTQVGAGWWRFSPLRFAPRAQRCEPVIYRMTLRMVLEPGLPALITMMIAWCVAAFEAGVPWTIVRHAATGPRAPGANRPVIGLALGMRACSLSTESRCRMSGAGSPPGRRGTTLHETRYLHQREFTRNSRGHPGG